MAEFNTKQIRNLALLGHGGCGKTSVAEAMLYVTGAIDRLGNTAQGNTTCDYDPEARARGFSLAATPAFMTWKDTRINVLDTPGFLDFTGEVRQAVRVADAAVICVDGKAGVEVGTELAWDIACEAGIPRAFFVNKCDDEECKFERVFRQLHATFGVSVCPVFIPVETGKDVTMIDLLTMRPIKYDEKGNRTETAMRIGWEHTASEFKDALNEALAGTADNLMEKFFEGESFTLEESVEALHNGIIQGTIVPVYCGSAVHLWGIVAMLDAIAASFPRPTARKFEKDENGRHVPITTEGDPALFVYKTVADPFVGKIGVFRVHQGCITAGSTLYVNDNKKPIKAARPLILQGKNTFETDELHPGDIGALNKIDELTYGCILHSDPNLDIRMRPLPFPKPMLGLAIAPARRGDEGRMSEVLGKMLAEDPTLSVDHDVVLNETVLRGLTEMHVRTVLERMKEQFKLEVTTKTPSVPYRETISGSAEGHARHKKQTGGAGQFGEVYLRVEPLPRGEGFVFADEVKGGAIPFNLIPAVEKGVREVLATGFVAGYPIEDIKVTVYDGKYHPVDSKEVAFVSAGRKAMLDALAKASPQVLEPIVEMIITAPDGYMGDITGDLASRRGQIVGTDNLPGGMMEIRAQVPLAELENYATRLHALTQGAGAFSMDLSGYQPVPAQKQAELASKFSLKAEED